MESPINISNSEINMNGKEHRMRNYPQLVTGNSPVQRWRKNECM